MTYRLCLISILGLLLGDLAFASRFTQSGGNVLCNIYIRAVKNNGKRFDQSFTSLLRNKRECLALAQIHNSNNTPFETRARRVTFSWNRKFIRGYTRTLPKKKPMMITRRCER